MFKLEFTTSGGAFTEETGGNAEYEIAGILNKIGELVKDYRRSGIIRDGNGATVGSWEYTPED
jgi:hypothetical protein